MTRIERLLIRTASHSESVRVEHHAGWDRVIAAHDPRLVVLHHLPTARQTWVEPAPVSETRPAPAVTEEQRRDRVNEPAPPARLDPPVTEPFLPALSALRRRAGFPSAVAAPLSREESRAAEPAPARIDPAEVAELIRVAMVDDARRHGIDV